VGRRTAFLPLSFATAAVGVLIYGTLRDVSVVAVALAGASLAATGMRLWLTFRENAAMFELVHHEASSDALTGLGNRRALMRDLAARLHEDCDLERTLLVLFDLDGFKHYNDSFGHPAGDALLARLGDNLARQLDGVGDAYRMGGDEFCAILRLRDAPADRAAQEAAAALAERGEGFSVTASYGGVVLPDDTRDPQQALRLADQRMYARKRRGRVSAQRQSRDVLLRALAERHPEIGEHLDGVADLAVAVCHRLGLEGDDVERVRHAAELHDIGKVAIPDAILDKPGPLDDDEWAFMRRHTMIGERIVMAAPALAPVARLIRASHERWDGTGYPDRLAGEAIPLGSRIVAVCDAYDAMVADRPYRRGMGHEAALAELQRCAGTQFDRAVVDAFCVETLASGNEPRGRPSGSSLVVAGS
jgi:two-component system, cell cycle response regulator